jgi:sodium/potassium-transporting ATPase subunit alpha
MGDASDAALLRFAQSLVEVSEIRSKHKKIAEIPFNSKNKWMVTMTEDSDSQYLLMMKGAPEILLEKCTSILINGNKLELTKEHIQNILENQENLGKNGERVIASKALCINIVDIFLVCYKKIEPREYVITHDFEDSTVTLESLCFVGLFSLMDRPRDEALPTIQQCQKAGIRVMMVTGNYSNEKNSKYKGDHPVTAVSIAKMVGIVTATKVKMYEDFDIENPVIVDDYAVAIKGSDLSSFTRKTWEWVLSHQQVVFARTQPEQKLRIVKECQRLGYVVAVTGKYPKNKRC